MVVWLVLLGGAKGLRQGNSLSPSFPFVLALEVFSSLMQQSVQEHGLNFIQDVLI